MTQEKLIKVAGIIILTFICVCIAIYIKNNIDNKNDLNNIQKNENRLKKFNDSLNILLQSNRKIRLILFRQRDSLERLLVNKKLKVKQDEIDINKIPISINSLSNDSLFKLFNYLYVQDSIININK